MQAPPKTLNVIGCGKAGKTIARLWTRHRVFHVGDVMNRSLASGARAVEFLGQGRAVAGYGDLEQADLIMIAAPDEAIEACCRQLCDSGVVRDEVIVFHLSGSLPSALLEPAASLGAQVASVHPVKSFADPAAAVETFVPTFCAVEGDPEACRVLGEALKRCGAIPFPVRPESKTVYHAGTVVVCNYLAALLEVGLRCFEQAGIPRETGAEILRPMVTETVSNVFRLGTVEALTGPIARGELSVVRLQSEALGAWNETIGRIYKDLGQIAVELSAAQGRADPEGLAAIERILRES